MAEASEALRGLIVAVCLVSENGVFKIELYGELAALLSLGPNHENKHPGGDASWVQVTLVAGASNIQDPTTLNYCGYPGNLRDFR
jgi:hypothetical protein